MQKYCLAILFFLCFCYGQLQAQEPIRISLVSDDADVQSDGNLFEKAVQEEIRLLLRNRRTVSFDVHHGNFDAASILKIYNDLFQNEETDIVIGLGALSSGVLAQLGTYPKPAIASLIIDQELQQIAKTEEGTSGISNFTYVESPFDITRDLEVLYEVFAFDSLVVFGGSNLLNNLPFLNSLMEQIQGELDFSYSVIPYTGNVASSVAAISARGDAVYTLPLFDEMSPEEGKALFGQLNQKGIPSASLLGDDYIAQGALLGYEAATNLQRMPRRLAINVSKIIAGTNAADIGVEMPIYNENLLLNMAAARQSGVYPSFELMATATLLNLNEVETDRRLSLQGAVTEGLQNNLGLQAVGFDPQLVEKDVGLARANLRPEITASTALSYIDESQVSQAFGAIGRLNWFLSGTLSQVVYSEPLLANVAIQKLLQYSSEAAVKQNELDVVLDVSNAFLGVLQAESFVKIQNENVHVTKDNYDISKAKEAVGYTGATDLNRWTSELAQRNIDRNDANAQLQQAKFNLNQLLNRPINEVFNVQEVSLEDQVLMVLDERITNLIDNPGLVEKFADFLVQEGMSNLPELQQLDFGIAATERQRISQKRAFYLPSLALTGQVDRTLGRYRGDIDKDIPLTTQYSLGLGLQYPILQGGKRRLNVQRTELSIQQLQAQRGDVRNQLELRIRSAMEVAAASYARLALSREAATAAHKNFEIVQDSYSQGLSNITNLIDAQNADLQTELTAVNAVYQFISDFLAVERSIGSYYFLASPGDRDAFIQRLTTFLANK